MNKIAIAELTCGDLFVLPYVFGVKQTTNDVAMLLSIRLCDVPGGMFNITIIDSKTCMINDVIVYDKSTLDTLFQVDKSITQEGAHE